MSEVAGLIDQIKAGGSGGFKYIENVKIDLQNNGDEYTMDDSFFIFYSTSGENYFKGTIKLTPKEDNVSLYIFDPNFNDVTSTPKLSSNSIESLSKGTEYSFQYNGKQFDGRTIRFLLCGDKDDMNLYDSFGTLEKGHTDLDYIVLILLP